MTKLIHLPELGENILSGDILEIFVAAGDTLLVDHPIMELETEKATLEVPATTSGKIIQVLVSKGQVVKVGQAILEIEETEMSTVAEGLSDVPEKVSEEESVAEPTPSLQVAVPGNKDGRIPVSAPPSVRKFAREIGVDLTDVAGTGPGGRISMDDVKTYSRLARQKPNDSGLAQAGIPAPRPLPDFSQQGPIKREAMTKIRKVTVRSMAGSWATIPHVTLHRSVKVTQLERQRKLLKERGAANLTFTAILIKFTAHALKRFPKLNASIDVSSDEIIFKNYWNVGVAVDTPKGLMVPVVKQADQKNIQTIADDLTYLSEKARSGKLTLEEMTGATFTITNLGGLGTEQFTPIINAPESAILGVGRALVQPFWNGTEFKPEQMLPLSLSFDHRLIDGAEGARFMQWLADAIDNPLILSLEG